MTVKDEIKEKVQHLTIQEETEEQSPKAKRILMVALDDNEISNVTLDWAIKNIVNARTDVLNLLHVATDSAYTAQSQEMAKGDFVLLDENMCCD